MHNLRADVIEEFAEAQKKGRNRHREFRWDQGWQIHKGMKGACDRCGLPVGMHTQGCKMGLSVAESYSVNRAPLDRVKARANIRPLCPTCRAPLKGYRGQPKSWWVHLHPTTFEKVPRCPEGQRLHERFNQSKRRRTYGFSSEEKDPAAE